MKARLLPPARAEAKSAAHWYESEQQGLGDDFVLALDAALEIIENDPHRFARVETVRTTRDIHRIPLARFPFYVIYEIRADEVVVVAVAHAKRRPGYWMNR